MRTSKTLAVVLFAAAFWLGCGSKAPPPAESAAATTSAQGSSDPNRPLSKSECESLAQTIVDACNNRGNERSAGMDGWCSDMIRGNTENGNWVEGDCMKHIKYMDYFCFQGAKNAHAMMDCDRTVDRSQ